MTILHSFLAGDRRRQTALRCALGMQRVRNKDDQRMILMIINSLGSFITAVTPTAVAPIAVILPVFTLI